MRNFRSLPSVDKVLSLPGIARLRDSLPHDNVVTVIREELAEARERLSRGEAPPTLEDIAEGVQRRGEALLQPSLRRVINATGVVLHTNLGRAPLSREAITTMEEAAGGYCNLEFSLEEGERGSRQRHGEGLLCHLTGAEAAMVVNNNASAVLLALTSLAKGKEVIVSRGQAVEIGGGFRLPQVMRQSGAKMVEVGTTNRTYLFDYEEAITPKTASLLRVHTSNFRIVGFASQVGLEELAGLATKHGLLLLDDLGSGCLLDTTRFGLGPEPTIQGSLKAGASLVFSSADKLLGGPQGGIILGRKDLVARLQKHPLARAVRIGKLDLAALEATLRHYVKGEAEEKIPIWRMIASPLEELERRARVWARALGEGAKAIPGQSAVGGGSLPGETLPTYLLAIAGPSLESLARRLREGSPPVIARIEKGHLLLDPRTVLPEEDEAVVTRLKEVLTKRL